MKIYTLQPNFFDDTVDIMSDNGLETVRERAGLPLFEAEVLAFNAQHKSAVRSRRIALQVEQDIQAYTRDLVNRGLLKGRRKQVRWGKDWI